MRTITFRCGCTYPETETAKHPVRGSHICPVHGKTAKSKSGNCLDCGCHIDVNMGGHPRTRCRDCQLAYVREKKRQDYQKYGVPNPVKTIPIRKPDCKFYLLKCLVPPSGALLKDSAACVGCKRYQPIPDDATNYITCGDSITAFLETA